MEINTTLSIDTDDLANELADTIRQLAEEVMESNNCDYQDESDVQDMIDGLEVLDEDDVQQLINDAMMDVTDNTDTVNEITTEYRDLRNEVEKLRRSMRVLLEERERSVVKRVKRGGTYVGNKITDGSLWITRKLKRLKNS